jgi:formate dehydrogenase iron-sulfur subunit
VTARRLLPTAPLLSFADYARDHDGGAGLEAARSAGPDAVIAALEASGLRGRGGAGFPAGR